ncbi:PA3496 family putative envelope integrity protein [Oceanospirillum sp.]|uniref:PA3496 family putative envelope integrity protein n=1 Tax=Oceanospirillum sp. TaxID=2021254 RepID=UPI003A9537C1
MGREDVSFDDTDDIFDDTDDAILKDDEERELSKHATSQDKRRIIEDRLEQKMLQRNISDYYDFDDLDGD